MLVWVASFPRSGNTFLRIVLNRLYGIRTSVVYDVDGVAARVGGDLVGYTDRPGSLAEMRAAPERHFIKTHRPRDAAVDPGDHVIHLVRDGRDALVSWARQLTEDDPDRFHATLKDLIDGRRGSGSWGTNVLSWPETMLTYADLIADPIAATGRAMAAVAPDMQSRADREVPTFDDLRKIDGKFFRRGKVGSHADEMPADLAELFWARPDNRAAMRRLG